MMGWYWMGDSMSVTWIVDEPELPLPDRDLRAPGPRASFWRQID